MLVPTSYPIIYYNKFTDTNPVLRMSGWTLYSLANTKGTIPWGRAAYKYMQYNDEYTEQTTK